mgnify:CR=1 FL=1
MPAKSNGNNKNVPFRSSILSMIKMAISDENMIFIYKSTKTELVTKVCGGKIYLLYKQFIIEMVI